MSHINDNPYKYCRETLKSLFLHNDISRFRYIICDKFGISVLDKFFNFNTFNNKGLKGYIEIENLSNNMNDESLATCRTEKFCYFVLPTLANFTLIKEQMTLFNDNVTILFTDGFEDMQFLSDLKNVIGTKKILLNMHMFDKKLVVTENDDQLKCFIQLINSKGNYKMIYSEDYDKSKCPFSAHINSENDSIVDSAIIMLDRTFDMLTPFLIPWNYESMLHFYYTIKNNQICIEDDKLRLDSDEDEVYNKIKYFDSSDVVSYLESGKKISNNNNKFLELHEEIMEYIEISASNFDAIRAHSIQEEMVGGQLTFQEFESKLIKKNIMNRGALVLILNLAHMIYNNAKDIINLAIKLDINVTNNDLVDRTTELVTVNSIQNKKIKFKIKNFQPHLKTVLDCIFDRNGMHFNDKFMKHTDYTKFKNIIIHINRAVTYEEKRIIDTYKCGNVNLILHSSKII